MLHLALAVPVDFRQSRQNRSTLKTFGYISKKSTKLLGCLALFHIVEKPEPQSSESRETVKAEHAHP
mgnify:CR=1